MTALKLVTTETRLILMRSCINESRQKIMRVLSDEIYGKAAIKEPVLLELLESPSILRLKGISQYGVPNKYYHFKNYSRYEHSVGVMLLLRGLGVTLEEQVAGLLHDVSVLAFSHIADWVFSRGDRGVENLHDSIHRDFIERTEIPGILERFGFSIERIMDEGNFPFLERKIPDLCADRVDYALREFKYWLDPKLVSRSIKNLVNFNGEIVFFDCDVAFDFATNFLKLQTNHWGSYEAIVRYYLFSEALKIALREGVVLERDFYRDEEAVLSKIERRQHEEIESMLALLKKKEIKDFGSKSGRRVVKKFRYVDPKVIIDGRPIRLSILVPRFRKIVERRRKINREGLVV